MTTQGIQGYIFWETKMKQEFIKYKKKVENQLSEKIKQLRTNRGGEYEFNPFNSFCEYHKIIHEATSYSPKSNGVVTRKK